MEVVSSWSLEVFEAEVLKDHLMGMFWSQSYYKMQGVGCEFFIPFQLKNLGYYDIKYAMSS